MKMHEVATDKNGQSLPVVRLNWPAGKVADGAAGVTVDGNSAALISVDADAYICVTSDAEAVAPGAAVAGSLYLPAGLPLHTILRAGERVLATRVTAGSVNIFVIPLA